jgi:hypothetical protein
LLLLPPRRTQPPPPLLLDLVGEELSRVEILKPPLSSEGSRTRWGTEHAPPLCEIENRTELLSRQVARCEKVVSRIWGAPSDAAGIRGVSPVGVLAEEQSLHWVSTRARLHLELFVRKRLVLVVGSSQSSGNVRRRRSGAR